MTTFVSAVPYPWPFDGKLQRENTALVIIDMQTDFCGKGGYIDLLGYDLSASRACIEPIGYLDLYLTFSGYRILPTVARVQPGYELSLCEAEVADAFEVPLAFLMDVQNHSVHSREWKGVTRRYYAMPFADRYIWGVTAGILRNLYERIYMS